MCPHLQVRKSDVWDKHGHSNKVARLLRLGAEVAPYVRPAERDNPDETSDLARVSLELLQRASASREGSRAHGNTQQAHGVQAGESQPQGEGGLDGTDPPAGSAPVSDTFSLPQIVIPGDQEQGAAAEGPGEDGGGRASPSGTSGRVSFLSSNCATTPLTPIMALTGGPGPNTVAALQQGAHLGPAVTEALVAVGSATDFARLHRTHLSEHIARMRGGQGLRPGSPPKVGCSHLLYHPCLPIYEWGSWQLVLHHPVFVIHWSGIWAVWWVSPAMREEWLWYPWLVARGSQACRLTHINNLDIK